jgi:hypothetical protein
VITDSEERDTPSSAVMYMIVQLGMAGFGLVVMEKVLVFADPRSKHQPSNLIVLSGQRDGAVAKHKSLQRVTLRVTSSKEPLRLTMVSITIPRFQILTNSYIQLSVPEYSGL